MTVYLEGNIKQALETGRNRLLVTGVVFMIAFVAISVRLVELTVFGPGSRPPIAHVASAAPSVVNRADIIDRNGVILATSLPSASLYADPRDVMNAGEAAAKLVKVLPNLNHSEILAKLDSGSRFVWLSRNLTPNQQYQVNKLGIPGLAFRHEERRVYPQGREAAHILGLTDIDGNGIAGIEKHFSDALTNASTALQLSVDIRIQSLLRRELMGSMAEFKARGAAGAVLDVQTGEVLAMVSLPDFDPNQPATMLGDAGFNRVTKGVYEMGSTFKLFTTAMALDSDTVNLKDGYDASEPIRIARYTINDYHGENRWLSVPEILVYSSNIGSARMAMDIGAKVQKFYLDRLGLLHPSDVELPEIGQPQTPRRWGDISTMTISYGHGISVSPLQIAGATTALVNGGIRRPVSLIKHRGLEAPEGERVLSTKTSDQMRSLMAQVVRDGTGKNAAVTGYRVGGKTGTAEKQVNGRYAEKALISSFVGAFPMNDPRYVLIAMLDEPKGTERTLDYATGGWVAAPVVGRMISAMGSMLGLMPERGTDGKDSRPRLASLHAGPGSGNVRLETY